MRSFKDASGRSWEIVMDPFTFGTVKARLGVDLWDSGKAMEVLQDDPAKFINTLYLLCGDQTEGKVSEREFCRGFNADVFESSWDTFLEELIFFSREDSKSILKRTVEKGKRLKEKVQSRLRESAEKGLENLDLDSLAIKLSDSLGTPQGKLESFREESPSTSSA